MKLFKNLDYLRKLLDPTHHLLSDSSRSIQTTLEQIEVSIKNFSQNPTNTTPVPKNYNDLKQTLLADKNIVIAGNPNPEMLDLINHAVDDAIETGKGLLICHEQISTNPTAINRITELCKSHNRDYHILNINQQFRNNKPALAFNPLKGLNSKEIANIITQAHMLHYSNNYTALASDLKEIISLKFGYNPQNINIKNLIQHLKKTLHASQEDQDTNEKLHATLKFLSEIQLSNINKWSQNQIAKTNYLELRDVFSKSAIVIVVGDAQQHNLNNISLLRSLFSAHLNEIMFCYDGPSQPSKIITSEGFILNDQNYFSIARRINASCIHTERELTNIKFRKNSYSWLFNSQIFINYKNSHHLLLKENPIFDIMEISDINSFNNMDQSEIQYISHNASSIIKKG